MLIIKQALTMFADYKTAEGLRLSTIEGYLRHLRLFQKFLPPDITLGDISASNVVAFLAHERQRGMSDHTVKGRDTAIDMFFAWCETILDVPSPIRNERGKRLFKAPKIAKKEPRRATDQQIDGLIMSIPQRDWWDFRDRAIISLMRDTGMRVTEASMLKVADVDTIERLITITASKNNKYRRVPFTERTARFIGMYLVARPFCPPEVAPFMFVGSSNVHGVVASHLTDSGIRQMIKRRCKDAGIAYINPHSVRHLFGLRSLNSGMRAEIVSNMMGHHSVDFTLKYYAPLLTETIQEEYDRLWNKP